MEKESIVFKRINTTITREDYKYAKQQGLKISQLIRDGIDRHKEQLNLINQGDSLESFKRKMEAWQKQAEKQRDFMRDSGLLDKYLKSEGLL